MTNFMEVPGGLGGLGAGADYGTAARAQELAAQPPAPSSTLTTLGFQLPPVPGFAIQSGSGLERVRSELASALRAADRGEKNEALKQIDMIRSVYLPGVSPIEFGTAHAEIEQARAQVYAGIPLSGPAAQVQAQVLDVEKALQRAAAEGGKTAADRIRREQVALDVAKRCPQLYESYGDVWSPEKLLAACNVANKEGFCAALPQPASWACNHPLATTGIVAGVLTAPYWLPWLGKLISGGRAAAQGAGK